jgi:hypothetical protein
VTGHFAKFFLFVCVSGAQLFPVLLHHEDYFFACSHAASCLFPCAVTSSLARRIPFSFACRLLLHVARAGLSFLLLHMASTAGWRAQDSFFVLHADFFCMWRAQDSFFILHAVCCVRSLPWRVLRFDIFF